MFSPVRKPLPPPPRPPTEHPWSQGKQRESPVALYIHVSSGFLKCGPGLEPQRGSGWWSTFLSEAISDPIESLPSTPGCRSGLWAKGELLTKFKIEPGWLPSSPSPSAPPSCLAHLALPPLHFFLNSNFFRSVFYLSPSAPPSKPRKLMSTPSTNLRKRSHLSVSMCATLELID